MNIRNHKDLIFGEGFIREPVDHLCNEINNNVSKKIILSGGRGSGKSVVLYNNEKKNLGNDTQCIYTIFDSIRMFKGYPNDVFDDHFLNHYYELVFSNKLLHYIKNNYSLTYENSFKDLEEITYDLIKKLDNYINKACYVEVTLDKYLKPTELSQLIIERLKRNLNINTLYLSIDRFDWTNGNSISAQIILSKFFDMFDKVIITTDDESLLDKNNRKDFIKRGYSFIDINYGKDKVIIKELIKKRIVLYNKNLKFGNKTFNENNITDEIYQYLINKTNGNISLMLDIIKDVIDTWQWEDGLEDIYKQFEFSTKNQIESSKTLRKMTTQIKLHF